MTRLSIYIYTHVLPDYRTHPCPKVYLHFLIHFSFTMFKSANHPVKILRPRLIVQKLVNGVLQKSSIFTFRAAVKMLGENC